MNNVRLEQLTEGAVIGCTFVLFHRDLYEKHLHRSRHPVAQWLARHVTDQEVSGSDPANHNEKCHRGAMG